MDDRQRAREDFKKLSFAGKLEHIGYYYKWFIILGIVALTFIIICIVQFATRKNYDAIFMYAGPQNISSSQLGNILDSFDEVMSEDHNGDGEKAANFVTINLYPKISHNSKTDPDKDVYNKALQHQNKNLERFYLERTSGSSVIYLIDEEIYPQIAAEDYWLVPLEDILGYLPENALDEKGIRLRDLDCYKYTDLCYLPSDSVLCIRYKRDGTAKDDSDKAYASNLDTFIDMITWTKPEESENE